MLGILISLPGLVIILVAGVFIVLSVGVGLWPVTLLVLFVALIIHQYRKEASRGKMANCSRASVGGVFNENTRVQGAGGAIKPGKLDTNGGGSAP